MKMVDGLGQVGCLLEQVGGADRQDGDGLRRQFGQRRPGLVVDADEVMRVSLV